MYNYKIKKVDVFSAFKYGIFLGTSIAIAIFVLLLFYILINSTIQAIGPKLFTNLFLNGMVQLFFYLIILGFAALAVSGIATFSAFIYNITSSLFGEIKLELEAVNESLESEDTKEDDNDTKSE